MNESERLFYEKYGDENGKLNWDKLRADIDLSTRDSPQEHWRRYLEARERDRNSKEHGGKDKAP